MTEIGVQAEEAEPPSRALTAAVLAVCGVLLSPLLAYRMGVDQGVFAHIGAQILEGRWPYMHAWESDFPGMMILQAIEIALLGKSIVMFRLFDWLWQLANAYLIWRIALGLGSRAGAFLAASTFALIYQGYGPWNTGQREGFALLFILAGFRLWQTAGRRRPSLTAGLIGLGLGIATLFKPTLLALAALYLPLARDLERRHWPILVGAGVGLAAPVLPIIAFYWAQGGLLDLYEACIAYQGIYGNVMRSDDPFLIDWLSRLQRLGGTAIGLSLAFLPFAVWGSQLPQRRMLYLGYLAATFTVLVQGTFAGYHYLTGLGIGSVLIAIMFSQVCERILGATRMGSPRLRRMAPALLAVGVLIAALPLYSKRNRIENLVTLQFLNPPRVAEFSNLPYFDFTESWDLAHYLKEKTSADEPIYIWGYEPLVYYLAERAAPSRFQITHPLVLRVPGEPLSPMQQRWRAEFMRDIEESPPSYLVVVRDDGWWWSPGEQSSEQLLDDFPRWKDFILLNYRVEHSIGRFLIHRRCARFPCSPEPIAR